MRVESRICIAASREEIWGIVADPRRHGEFMDGLVVSDLLTPDVTGCGMRWSLRLLVGAAALGGTVEVVEWEPPGDLAWNAVTGISLRGRWRLRERGPDQTEVRLRLAYQAPGGLSGVVADWVASPLVKRRLDRSLRRLRAVVETAPREAAAR
jgi:uncharacterized membrane protein